MNRTCILKISGGNTPILEGGFLWIKSVKGFVDSQHCIKCFKGKYINLKHNMYAPFEKGIDYPFTPDTDANLETILIDGQIPHYLCGVSQNPYIWKDNLHIGFIYCEGGQIEKEFRGQTITLLNAKELYFDDSKVLEKYSHLDKSFTTCRNFHFASYLYA